MAVLPNARPPMSDGVVLCAAAENLNRAFSSFSRPTSGSSEPSVAACVRSRLNSASKEVSLGRFTRTFFAPSCGGQFLAQGGETQPRSCRISAAKLFSWRRNCRANKCSVPTVVLSAQTVGFFGSVTEDAFGFRAQRHFDGVEMRSRIVMRDSFPCEWIQSSPRREG